MTTKPEVRTLPQLDEQKIAADAEAWVAERVAAAQGDVAEVARISARIVIAQNTAAEKARIERDRAAYTLERDYVLRRGSNLAGALGVQRSRLMVIRRKMKDLDTQGQFEAVEHADRALPKAALRAATGAARADAAERHRNAAVKHLLEVEGLSNAEVAKIIGRDPSRVSHIKHMEVA